MAVPDLEKYKDDSGIFGFDRKIKIGYRMVHQLVIFFNEDYSKNIPILERIYASRFPDRLYIVPDHNTRFESGYRSADVKYRNVNRNDRMYCKARRVFGKRNRHELKDNTVTPSIVRVTGFKYFFQDYFWQAREALLVRKADWYWFVADDLLLNPSISADNILDFFSVSDFATKSVICEPFYRSDEWVNWFQPNYENTIKDLQNTGLNAAILDDRRFRGDPHKSGSNQKRIVAGCADFFGCHRSVLELALEGFHSLALRKIFVEITLPNVLLSLDPHARTTHEYQWEFGAVRGNQERIRDFLERSHQQAFYHPVKLGVLPPDFVDGIILGGVQK